MPDQTQTSNNQMIIIALAVIAVLLAAIVGVLMWQANQAKQLPDVTTTPATGQAQTGATTPGAATGAATGSTAFDPKTATKVPSGMTPEQALKAYNEDIIKGKFADAYKLLPLDKQQSYGDATSYEAQVKAYGITSYELGAPTQNGDTVTIVSTQVTPQMPISYTWTYQKVGGQWYVKSRTMGGQ